MAVTYAEEDLVRIQFLTKLRSTGRARLTETARNLDLIDHKIDFYRERLAAR